ncbi:hypothetical protein ABZV67_23175 [Streptomyces sp. NPDC005065]|uniref:hypothetical protein n=1 Tax=Streptomyces sp. NPDC005065 TaxID=3154461 RepID=UPI00339E07F2
MSSRASGRQIGPRPLLGLHGTKGEQTMQAGNAVSCNVAQWIGERVADVLSRTAAVG